MIFNKRNLYSIFSRLLYITNSWKTNKKIIVIESDDWGSIRMSNKENYSKISNKGYNMSLSNYTFDSLENNDDLTALFEILESIKDNKGRKACFTANMVMANPDFEKIKNNNFEKYFYETVDKTLNNYDNSDQVRSLWKEGMKNHIFHPQYHAREHIQYWSWLTNLKNGQKEALETFNYNICGLPRKVSKINCSYYVPIYVDDNILIKNGLNLGNIICEGLQLFEKEFGFSSKSVIAPNCGWTPTAEYIWKNNNVKFIQGAFLQEYHYQDYVNYIPHYLGEKSKKSNLTYLVRNCTFEPSKNQNENYWEGTLSQIKMAFKLNTPAIISTHRVNYIGSINESNRERSLNQLKKLLLEIKKRYPEVEFMTSVELGDLICQ